MLTLNNVKSLTLLYRCLNNHTRRNFGIYTNETLKKNFDEKLKEKYFTRDQKEYVNPEDEQNAKLFEEMKEAYEDVYSDLQSQESILRSYKKQVVVDEGDIYEQQQIAEDAKFVVKTENHFRGVSTSEFMKRSKNLMDSFRNKQAWSPEYNERISDEYLEYDKYRKNYSKLRDVKQTEDKATEEYSLGSNILNYMRNIDDSMKEKKMSMTVNDRIKDQIANPEAAQEAIERYWQNEGKDKRNPMMRQVRQSKINLGEPEDSRSTKRPVFGRVSPYAREQIYKLHLEGWTVRDLSIRYGLLPERVKMIIWNRQYFYDEILPNVDLATVQLALEKEMMYSMYFPWVDYGGDLAMLAERDRGVFFQRYRTTEIDANPPKEIQDKMEKVLESQTKKKYDIVTENFVGRGPKGFYVKSWIVNKGHGSERVNRKFKMAVQHTQNAHLMPDKVRKNLKEGPRIASKGYGIK